MGLSQSQRRAAEGISPPANGVSTPGGMIYKWFTSSLTFLGVEAGRAEGQAGAHLGVVVEAPLARRALAGAPAHAALAALVAPPAPPRCLVAEKPRGARADTHPGGEERHCELRAQPLTWC